MTDSLLSNDPVTWLDQMGDLIGLSIYQGISIVLLLVMAAAFGALFSNIRKANHLNEKIEKLQHDLLFINSGTKGMGKQLLAMEKEIRCQKETCSSVPNNTEAEKKHTHTKVTPLHTCSGPSSVSNNSAPVKSSNEKTHFADVMNAQQEDDAGVDYDEVKNLLAQGFDIQHVIKQSRLSHAEVSLISTLHHNAGDSTPSQTLHR